jgi:hypothetical protein
VTRAPKFHLRRVGVSTPIASRFSLPTGVNHSPPVAGRDTSQPASHNEPTDDRLIKDPPGWIGRDPDHQRFAPCRDHVPLPIFACHCILGSANPFGCGKVGYSRFGSSCRRRSPRFLNSAQPRTQTFIHSSTSCPLRLMCSISVLCMHLYDYM